MSIDKELLITEIQRFSVGDGDGIRTCIFLKGCPLRCEWCHNPETQNISPELLFYKSKCIECGLCINSCKANVHTIEKSHQINRGKCLSCFECTKSCPTIALEKCGNKMTIEKIISEVEKDRAFFGNNGGVTLSGGEPFMQKHAAVDLLKACKERGITTAVETCGYAAPDVLLSAVPFTDLFLWDIKDTDSDRHKRYTSASNELILKNLHAVSDAGARLRLRCILINGINTEKAHYESIANIALDIKNLEGVEFIPYHAYAGTKATFLGHDDNGKVDWIPSALQIEQAKEILRKKGISVI